MLSKMKQITLIFTVLLAACGGGDEQGPIICGKNYCDDQGHVIFVEHNATNAEHIKQGRAVLAEDGIAYTNEVPIGKSQDFTAICEFSVGEFVAGSC